MKKLIIGYLAFCTNHGQARCHSKMANKNDSSQMRECLTHSDVPSGEGPSQDTTDGLSSKQSNSESSGTEATNSGQRPGAEAQTGDPQGEEKLRTEPECHMQLDKLSGNRDHTVLIDPVNAKGSRWEATEIALKRLKNGHPSVTDVEKAIKAYNHAYVRDWRFDGLYSYVQAFPRSDTFSYVISKMAKLALKLPALIQCPIPLLKQGQSHTITMSQEQISCLLANAFFCTFPHRNATHTKREYGNFPTINFNSLFADRCPRRFQKLIALFHYFNTVTEEATKPNGLVTFERICLPPSKHPDWPMQTETMTKLRVYSKGFIEHEGKGMLQVDFAASMIGGGVLGRGLVQEEIRFIQCPELIVARLFTEKLAENECIKITGVQQYSNTTGYSDSFMWNSPHDDQNSRDEWKRRYCQIVAIDALNFDDPREQFTENSIKRELLKAYVGFKDYNTPNDYTPAIATGNWGCGAFKGDPMLKALIQMMAAAVAQRDVAYITFDNKELAENLKRMYQFLKDHEITVGKLYNLLQDYCRYYRRQQQYQQPHQQPYHHHPHQPHQPRHHQRNQPQHPYHHQHQLKVKNVFDYIREKIGVRSSQL